MFLGALNTGLSNLVAFHLVDGFCRLWKFLVPTWPQWRDVQLCVMGFRATGWEMCMCAAWTQQRRAILLRCHKGTTAWVLALGSAHAWEMQIASGGVSKGWQHTSMVYGGSRASLTAAWEQIKSPVNAHCCLKCLCKSTAMLHLRGYFLLCKRMNPQLKVPEEQINNPKTAKASAAQPFTCNTRTLDLTHGQWGLV